MLSDIAQSVSTTMLPESISVDLQGSIIEIPIPPEEATLCNELTVDCPHVDHTSALWFAGYFETTTG